RHCVRDACDRIAGAGGWRDAWRSTTNRARDILRLTEENCLPAVRVARPLIEYKHSEEVPQISHRVELFIRQKIIDGHQRRMTWELRPELFSWRTRFSAKPELHHELSGVRNQFRTDLDHVYLRHAQSQSCCQSCSKHFICQNAQVLGIVLKFDHVVRAVV